jgi:hypothetical protein
VLTNVCFEGKNGYDAGVTPFPLMTQSGHRLRLTGRRTIISKQSRAGRRPPSARCQVFLGRDLLVTPLA